MTQNYYIDMRLIAITKLPPIHRRERSYFTSKPI